ncbi:MAG TPA: L-fucose:H+ symporter permease [Terracidiphilus sp.]
MSISAGPVGQRNQASGNNSGNNKGIEAPLVPAGRLLPFLMVTVLFFLWGVPNNLNDILISQFMKSFEINRLQAGLVQSAFYMGYFLLAMPAAQLMRRFGYKAGIMVGLILYGSGCILFWPAALMTRYSFFLMALFVIASGLSFLETAASPFIIQLGDPATAEQRINFSQAFNPLGSIMAVLIGSRFIFSGIELKPGQVAAMQAQHTYHAYLRSETLRVVNPYLILGGVVLFWAVLIALTPFPHAGLDFSRESRSHDTSKPMWRRKHFSFSVIAQFLYVGAQVGTWSFFIAYAMRYTDLTQRSAGYWLTGVLVAFTAGRFVSTWLMQFVSGATLLGIYAIANAVICAVAVLWPGWLGVSCLIAVSFFMSIMYPTIFALGVKGLGQRTKSGSAFIVMSIVGGAALTPLMGVAPTVAEGYIVPAVCFVGVAIYALFLSKPEPEELAEAV